MIDKFTGEHLFLDNYYVSPIYISGVIYPTAAHAYAAQRCASESDRGKFVSCKAEELAGLMKTCPPRKQWTNSAKASEMYRILRLKFSDLGLAKSLLDTKSEELYYTNRTDTFWGVVRNGDGNLIGENKLGIMLMKIREELKVFSSACIPITCPGCGNCDLSHMTIVKGNTNGTTRYGLYCQDCRGQNGNHRWIKWVSNDLAIKIGIPVEYGLRNNITTSPTNRQVLQDTSYTICAKTLYLLVHKYDKLKPDEACFQMEEWLKSKYHKKGGGA